MPTECNASSQVGATQNTPPAGQLIVTQSALFWRLSDALSPLAQAQPAFFSNSHVARGVVG